MPQWRKTTTVSEVARAARTAWSSRGTSFADASPGFPGPAVQAEISSSSSTWVAPMTAIRWPLIVRRNGRYACFASSADPDDREAIALRGGERVAKSLDAVVEPVVVRHRRDVDARPAQGGERIRGCPEHELLRAGGATRRHCGLEIHDREVGPSKGGLDRIEDVSSAFAASFDSSTPSKWTSPPNARTTGRAARGRPSAWVSTRRSDEERRPRERRR